MSASWAPCTQVGALLTYYNNTKYCKDVLDQMRGHSLSGTVCKYGPVAVFCNILDLAGINARILFKEQQQQESLEESPAAAGRGAEGRIHGRERGCSQHKVGSSGSNHRSSSRHGDGGSAGPKELQTEPNIGHLKCHKPECANCAKRAEVMCRLWPVIKMALFFAVCFRSACLQLFWLLLFFVLYIIKC